MKINFIMENNQLLLTYIPDDDNDQILNQLRATNSFTIRNIFYFTQEQSLNFNGYEDNDSSLKFLLGEAEGEYFIIEKTRLDIKHNVRIQIDLFVQKNKYAHPNNALLPNIKSIKKMFIADNYVSIFKYIDRLCDDKITIGGADQGSIPCEDFNLLLLKFPTSTRLKHYASSLITNVLQEYFSSMIDGERRLQKHIRYKEKKIAKLSMNKVNFTQSIPESILEADVEKYKYILDTMKYSLNNKTEIYSEKEWQKEIEKVFLLIFPQYICIISDVKIKEQYSKDYGLTNRFIDFVLVKATGYIDIIEIKRPFDSAILLTKKYRDNYIPKSELSGAIMQSEKYIYYLNSLNKEDERKLTEKHKAKLPDGLKIKIRNPKAFILIGRSDSFNDEQKNDFEFIKRKYNNIMDIMTYDDFLNRIDNILQSIKKRVEKKYL